MVVGFTSTYGHDHGELDTIHPFMTDVAIGLRKAFSGYSIR